MRGMNFMSRIWCLLIWVVVWLSVSCSKDTIVSDTPSDTIFADTVPLISDTLLEIKPCSIWQGHVVAFVDSIAGGYVDLTLISLRDWDKIYSANSPNANFDTIVHTYAENELSQWSIPTETQARRLKASYNDDSTCNTLVSLNSVLQSIHADTIATVKGAQKIRYLCQEAIKSFSHRAGTNVTNAGVSTKYHLRLVNVVRLSLRDL